jgi:hypothetical protein
MVQDYEPVMVSYDSLGKIICLVTRRHWAYQVYGIDEGLVVPPAILFDGIQHPPFPKTRENEEWFETRKLRPGEELIEISLEPRLIKANEIPQMFRTGVNHPSKQANPITMFKNVKDPYRYMREEV